LSFHQRHELTVDEVYIVEDRAFSFNAPCTLVIPAPEAEAVVLVSGEVVLASAFRAGFVPQEFPVSHKRHLLAPKRFTGRVLSLVARGQVVPLVLLTGRINGPMRLNVIAFLTEFMDDSSKAEASVNTEGFKLRDMLLTEQVIENLNLVGLCFHVYAPFLAEDDGQQDTGESAHDA
jgi:hypothetical protein